MAGVELGGSSVSTSPLMAGNNPSSANTESASWPPPQKNKKKLILVLILFLLSLAGGGVFWFFHSRSVSPQPQEQPKSQEKKTAFSTQENQPEVEPSKIDSRYQSENFRAESIIIGGEAELFVPEDDLSSFEIADIRGEAFAEKSKQEIRLVITWKTNKLSQAEIEYSKGSGQAPKVVLEEGFGISHSITISGLDQASTYVYMIKSSDRFGNTVSSEQHAVYTGSKTVSLFDLIADAVGEVFGWAVKKK
ncbi:MAG: hypothetical protein KA054_02155 [Candidatus Moranbacteria bacterium]|nr:hypothetical protein [Candidatus Moranbacteria bacterium]